MPDGCLACGGIDDCVGKIQRFDVFWARDESGPVELGIRADGAKHGSQYEVHFGDFPHFRSPSGGFKRTLCPANSKLAGAIERSKVHLSKIPLRIEIPNFRAPCSR